MVASIEEEGAQSIEELEIALLLEGVFRRFGLDFRGYRRAHVTRKLRALMRELGAATVSSLQDKVMHDTAAASALLRVLSMRGSMSCFDDPAYFGALRMAVVPLLPRAAGLDSRMHDIGRSLCAGDSARRRGTVRRDADICDGGK